MISTSLTFDIAPTDAANPIGVEVWLDNQRMYDFDRCTRLESISVEFDDNAERLHQLKIVIKNKTSEHTRVDPQGNIVADSSLIINNFMLDGIEITQVVSNLATYEHNFNGSGDWVKESFFNTVGCNGTVTFSFSTPSYLWLLENM